MSETNRGEIMVENGKNMSMYQEEEMGSSSRQLSLAIPEEIKGLGTVVLQDQYPGDSPVPTNLPTITVNGEAVVFANASTQKIVQGKDGNNYTLTLQGAKLSFVKNLNS